MNDRFDDLSTEDQVKRLRFVVEVLADWLVQAQTGFGSRDAQGILDLIEHGAKADDE